MDQQMAQGTAMIMVLPAVIVTLRNYHQRHRLDLAAAAVGGGVSVLFTWIGARLALGMDPITLRYVYAFFVLLIALFYFQQTSRRHRRSRSARPQSEGRRVSLAWFAPVGVVVGT